MAFSRPGVYVSERDLPTPVTSVGTANAAGACIGYFQKGPEAVTRVVSYYDFATTFGDLNPLYPATYGVSQFFQNGGNELYVRRVTNGAAVASANVTSQSNLATNITGITGTAASGATALTISAENKQITVGMKVSGTGIDSTGDGTFVAAYSGTGTAVTLSKVTSGVVTAGTALTFAAGNTTKFVSKYKGTDANLLRVQLTPTVITSLTTATNVSYATGVVTVTVPNSLTVGQLVTITGAAGFTSIVEFPIATASATGFTINTLLTGSPAAVTTGITLTVYSDYWSLIVAKETVNNESPDTFSNDLVLETYNNVVFNNKQSSDYIGTILSLRSDYIKVDETTITAGTALRPAYANPLIFTSGSDGSAPAASDYTGSSNAVLKEFDVLERPLVVFAPELANQITDANAKTVFNGMTTWAESNGKAFIVADTASGNTVATAITTSNALTASSYGAIYYPNFYVPDSKAQSANALRLVGPSSAVAGLMLATDRAVGPHKSAAGISAKLAGAVALEVAFTSSDLDSLNVATNPVNAIRNLPGAGIVVMGGRTLKSSSTITKYISTRRSLFYIKRQMEVLTQFALFENNSEILWSRVRTTLTAFLNEYRNQGGLRGATVDQSFYIKVDAENNDATSIAAGIVNVEVGVALERPAEFVVITLSQMTTI
jgi:hypothetical protein